MYRNFVKITELMAITSGIIVSNYTVYYMLSDTSKYRQKVMKEGYEKRIKELEDLVKNII